ncbi:thioesterase II family protein [Bacillus rhizoplanae]|uniref:thioesterase II family protein n=1 Tax=Bacillus rhizoplanae TaxID=2880966 RepID=UPI003D1B0C12
MKLLCLPHSGSSACCYLKWRNMLDKEIEVIPVEFPGRGKRFAENLSQNMPELVENLYNYIKNEIGDSEYAVFGHSLGGLVAYELIIKMLEKGHRAPVHLFVSGCNAPHIKYKRDLLHKLPNNQFFEHILALGGMAEEVVSNEELLEVFIPIIKADYKIYETYTSRLEPIKLGVDVTVFTGDSDPLVTIENVNEWSLYTYMMFKVNVFNGGHFFLYERSEEVIHKINQTLLVQSTGR